MKVRAIQAGYYGHQRREEGEEFVLEPIKRMRKTARNGVMKEVLISTEQQFSARWMEKIEPEVVASKKQGA